MRTGNGSGTSGRRSKMGVKLPGEGSSSIRVIVGR
jgi:hypothetical protein